MVWQDSTSYHDSWCTWLISSLSKIYLSPTHYCSAWVCSFSSFTPLFSHTKKKWLNVLDTLFLVDISILSTYATVAAGPLQYSGLNLFIYEATPYILILFPFCYLFGVVAVLLLKRFYAWLKGSRLRSLFTTSNTMPTSTLVAMDYAAAHDSTTSEVRGQTLWKKCTWFQNL